MNSFRIVLHSFLCRKIKDIQTVLHEANLVIGAFGLANVLAESILPGTFDQASLEGGGLFTGPKVPESRASLALLLQSRTQQAQFFWSTNLLVSEQSTYKRPKPKESGLKMNKLNKFEELREEDFYFNFSFEIITTITIPILTN